MMMWAHPGDEQLGSQGAGSHAPSLADEDEEAASSSISSWQSPDILPLGTTPKSSLRRDRGQEFRRALYPTSSGRRWSVEHRRLHNDCDDSTTDGLHGAGQAHMKLLGENPVSAKGRGQMKISEANPGSEAPKGKESRRDGTISGQNGAGQCPMKALEASPVSEQGWCQRSASKSSPVSEAPRVIDNSDSVGHKCSTRGDSGGIQPARGFADQRDIHTGEFITWQCAYPPELEQSSGAPEWRDGDCPCSIKWETRGRHGQLGPGYHPEVGQAQVEHLASTAHCTIGDGYDHQRSGGVAMFDAAADLRPNRHESEVTEVKLEISGTSGNEEGDQSEDEALTGGKAIEFLNPITMEKLPQEPEESEVELATSGKSGRKEGDKSEDETVTCGAALDFLIRNNVGISRIKSENLSMSESDSKTMIH